MWDSNRKRLLRPKSNMIPPHWKIRLSMGNLTSTAAPSAGYATFVAITRLATSETGAGQNAKAARPVLMA